MSARQIRAAAKRKGIELDSVKWVWMPTPGENVPCYEVIPSKAALGKFDIDSVHYFDDTENALDWVEEVEELLPEKS